MLTRDQVFQGYRLLLGRPPEDEAAVSLHQTHATLADFVNCVMSCQEFIDRMARKPAPFAEAAPQPLALDWRRAAAAYHVPTELRAGRGPHRALLIGQCMFDVWPSVIQRAAPGAVTEHILINHLCKLPERPSLPWTDYDFQVVQVPLRSVLPEGEYLRLSPGDLAGHQRLFEACVERLTLQLQNATAWSRHAPTFVMNYLTPQQNLMGRLLGRYDLRNPTYFVEKLNEALASFLSAENGCHLLDADRIAGVIGRRYVQEDAICTSNHGGLINNFDQPFDLGRLEPAGSVWDHYDADPSSFIDTVWAEAVAMYETIRGREAVKMVCVDLDDTLWRGVLAEREGLDAYLTEGWPLGVLEALAYLKKRGVILCIVSKNDEAFIRDKWPVIFGTRFTLDDFAILKINWRPKAETIAEAIAEANILPSAVVFLDDNPVERAAVKAALPKVRVVSAPHYAWKRILLWSAETQVAAISAESARRTALIQAQIKREDARAGLSHEAFLAGLDLKVTLHRLAAPSGERFARAFELLNKTNQFNTTGERWTLARAQGYFADHGLWWGFEVADRFTHYGLVGTLAVRSGVIDQFVMSCRVIGLDVEAAVLAAIRDALGDERDLRGRVVATAANHLALDLYPRCGWQRDGEDWVAAGKTLVPGHVRIEGAELRLAS